MLKHLHLSPRAWPRAILRPLASAFAVAVFAFLDLVDAVLCFVYGFLDGILEENPIPCCCFSDSGSKVHEDGEISDTLHERKSLFRGMGFLAPRKRRSSSEKERGGGTAPRWSDCGCESCGAWRSGALGRLHFVVKESSRAARDVNECTEDVLFIHGFLSSSSFWTETVFPESTDLNFRMFAVDLLGFGRSPKPANSMYRLKDHVQVIERTIIEPFQLKSFHLVSHSMGCIVALALAAKYPARVKSITFLAPPYFPSDEAEASQIALNKLAKRQLWPPMAFGSAVMSWYEHIGRTICFVVCRNHLTWEWILKFLTRKRDVDFLSGDLTRHTHHSAWNTMHNVICGGAKQQDKNLEVVKMAGIPVKIIHGEKDDVVPTECSHNMKSKLLFAELHIINGCDHNTVILGREKDFTKELVAFWLNSEKQNLCKEATGCS